MGGEGGHGSMWVVGAVGVGVWVAMEGRYAVLCAVWVREGCGWAVSACGCWGRWGR